MLNSLARHLRLAVVFLSLSFLMTGCFGGGSVDEGVALVPNGRLFEIEEFTIQYPRDWRVLTTKDFPSSVPKETKLIFQHNVKGEFITNVNVGRVQVPDGTSSLDYSKSVIHDQRNGLVNYEELSREEIQLNVAGALVDTNLITFEGKTHPEAQVRKFMQVVLVKGVDAYSVTGAMRTNESEDIVTIVEGMLKSFSLN